MRKTDKNIRDSFRGSPDIKRNIEIANNFNKFLVEKVYDGFEVVLPARLGLISIVGTKQNITFDEDGNPNLPPDWVKTKKLWATNEQAKLNKKLIYHTNAHTGGIRYKFFWSKKRVLVQNKTLYSLRMTRTNKRRVYDEVVNNKKEYLVTKK
jgi:hypothetical protein